MPAVTHASSGYKSQRRDQAEGEGDSTEEKTEGVKPERQKGKERTKGEGENRGW
jgi:hypothetical protein